MNSCTQLRRMLVTHTTVSMVTGVQGPTRTEWVTKPCGVPLFSELHQQRGTCKSCAEGWTHLNNYPVDAL